MCEDTKGITLKGKLISGQLLTSYFMKRFALINSSEIGNDPIFVVDISTWVQRKFTVIHTKLKRRKNDFFPKPLYFQLCLVLLKNFFNIPFQKTISLVKEGLLYHSISTLNEDKMIFIHEEYAFFHLYALLLPLCFFVKLIVL